jgi:hypothetical protein
MHQVAQHTLYRPLTVELIEDQPDGGLHLLVGVDGPLASGELHVADRRGPERRAAAGLVDLALVHPLLEDVQLRLAHHPVQPKDEPVRVLGGVVQPVGVAEQHAEAGASTARPARAYCRTRKRAHRPHGPRGRTAARWIPDAR